MVVHGVQTKIEATERSKGAERIVEDVKVPLWDTPLVHETVTGVLELPNELQPIPDIKRRESRPNIL
jgi:hypothetical protein